MSTRRTNRDPAATANERAGDDAQHPIGSAPGSENASEDAPERTDTLKGTGSEGGEIDHDNMTGANFSATSTAGGPSHVGSIESDHAEDGGKQRSEAVLGADVTAANPGQAPHAQANFSPAPSLATKSADNDGVLMTQSQQRVLAQHEQDMPDTLATVNLPCGSEPTAIDPATGFPLRRQ